MAYISFMTKYNEYRLKAERFQTLLSTLATSGANCIDLSINTRVRFVTNSSGEKVIWTETYKNGIGWVRDI